MKASQRGIDLIKVFEKFEPLPYHDAVGILTIGYGHVIQPGEVFPVDGLTEQGASDLLRADLERREHRMNQLVTVPLSQEQWDALCSWTFNLGVGSLEKSTMLARINEGRFEEAATEMRKWVHAGIAGKVLPGLVARREKEAEVFLS